MQHSYPLTSVAAAHNRNYRERLSEAVWEVIDSPVDAIIEHVQVVMPNTAVEDIATEYITIIKIGLPLEISDDLEHWLPLMFEEEKMEVWRRIGLVGGAI
jgi:hypothetical protein